MSDKYGALCGYGGKPKSAGQVMGSLSKMVKKAKKSAKKKKAY